MCVCVCVCVCVCGGVWGVGVSASKQSLPCIYQLNKHKFEMMSF